MSRRVRNTLMVGFVRPYTCQVFIQNEYKVTVDNGSSRNLRVDLRTMDIKP